MSVGDTIEVGPPCGEFTLDPSTANGRPLVFIAGGIGITPLLSMAKSLAQQNGKTPVCFIQAARNSRVHALSEEVRALSADGANIQTHIVYDAPLADDLASGRCDDDGFVTTELLRQKTPFADADFYLCGPTPFMASVLSSLKDLGVSEDRVRHEIFGPKQAIAG